MWGNLQVSMHPSRVPSVLLYLSLNRTSSPGGRLTRAYQIQLLLFHINVLMWNQNTNKPRLPPYPQNNYKCQWLTSYSCQTNIFQYFIVHEWNISACSGWNHWHARRHLMEKGTLHRDAWHVQQPSRNHILLTDALCFSSRFGGEGIIKIMFAFKEI